MFEARVELDLKGLRPVQKQTEQALRQRGCQVLIYGDTGVGKSSLLTYAAESVGRKAVVVECNDGMDYDGILDHALRKIVKVREVSRTFGAKAELNAEASGSVPYLTTLKGGIKLEGGGEREFEVVQLPALDVLIEAMSATDCTLLVLDNFQNVALPVRPKLAQAMEALSDRARSSEAGGDIKMVVIGIAQDAETLLVPSVSFGRRVMEIGVPRMPDNEIRKILIGGFRLLGLQVTEDSLDDLVFYSDGFPYFAHMLGLEIAEAAREQNSQFIDASMVQPALRMCANAVSASYTTRMSDACEVGGKVQPRRRLLNILSRSNSREWHYPDVEALWKKEFGDNGKAHTFINVALSGLLKPEYGAILERKGTARRYVYRFADPHLRPFLRIAFDAENAKQTE